MGIKADFTNVLPVERLKKSFVLNLLVFFLAWGVMPTRETRCLFFSNLKVLNQIGEWDGLRETL